MRVPGRESEPSVERVPKSKSDYNGKGGGEGMNTCDLYDFPHLPVWCRECHAQDTQEKIAREMRRSNDLREQEINARIGGYWQEPEVKVIRQYMASHRAEPQKSKSKGGIQIEPRGS